MIRPPGWVDLVAIATWVTAGVGAVACATCAHFEGESYTWGTANRKR